MSTTTRKADRTLINGRTSLHLRQLDEGSGTPLLLLHDLFGSMGDWQSDVVYSTILGRQQITIWKVGTQKLVRIF